MNGLPDRAKNILLTPRTEWPVIAEEPDSAVSLYRRYILILAAIRPLAGLIKLSLFGISLPFTGATVRVGFGAALSQALVQYALSLIGVYLLALVVNALAPSFSAQKDQTQALKAVAYAFTASWVAGAAVLLPWIGFLLVLAGAVYSIYLLYLGLPATMKCPTERATAYTAVTVICAIVLGVVISSVTGMLIGNNRLGAVSGDDDAQLSIRRGDEEIEIDLNGFAKRMQTASQKMEQAQKSGDSQAQQAALGEAMGALFGGDGEISALAPAELKPFVPQRLAGMDRQGYSAERNSAMGLQISQAQASYQAQGRSLKLELTDMGGARGLTALAAWALVQTERESDEGYERVYRDGDRRIQEKWNASEQRGSYGLVIGERFLIELQAQGMQMDEIKSAAQTLNLQGLEALKDQQGESG